MRSLKYLPALLPFVSIGAYAEPDKDVWVVVTQTNTVTVCPITEWLTCNNDISTSLLTNTRSSHATTTSGNGSNGGNNTSTSHGGQGPSSTSHITTTITTTASHDGQGGPGSSSTSSGSSSTSTSQGGKGSSSTTSATSSTSLTGPYDGTTSTSTTSQGPYDSTTSTTTSSNGGYSNGTTTSQSLTSSTSTSSYNGFLNGTTTTQTSTSTTSGAEASTTSTTTQTLTSTSTTSGLGYNGTTTTSSSASSLTTTSFYGNVSVTTTTSLYGNNSSSTTSTLSTTTSIYGNASITTTGLSTTTTPINGTTTSFFGNITSTTTSFATTTTPVNSTSTCNNATHTATSLPETSCNDANSRSTWCGEKKVSDDTDVLYYSSQTKTFDLTITNTTADFDGINYFDFAINGQTPGPLIELNWGDIAIVTVHNQLQNNATTIHWHGVRQLGTNDQDGVPGVTECGIAPGSSRTYTFHASTYGTGWYHGHAMAQFGGGVRGPMIIHGPATANYDLDLGTIMIDDVYDSPMMEVAARAARTAGPPPVAVNYLLNGKNLSPDGTEGETPKWILKEGKKHLFRIINSSAQGSYIVHLDGHNFTVISADYTPIVPYVTDYLYIHGGQRYNIIVEANQPSSAYYFRAITQAGCAINNLNSGLGTNNGIFEYEKSCGVTPDNSFASSPLTINIGDCQDELLSNLKPIVSKNAGSESDFVSTAQTIPAGNAGGAFVNGYGLIVRWFFGGNGTSGTNQLLANYSQPTLQTMATVGAPYDSSIYSNAVVLDGTPGAWVYFVIQNPFRTSHPIHLHGHDFSVLGQGTGVFDSTMAGQLDFTNPIRRDTALLYGTLATPSGWTVIGFQTNNPGAWIMHCHIIWHADGGMALQYIEQPASANVDQYYNTAFQDECSALNTYQAQGPDRLVESFQSGIKRRQHLDAHLNHAAHRDVVRHI